MESVRVIKVFLASPMDLVDERAAFRRVVDRISEHVGRRVGVCYDVVCWERDVRPDCADDAQDVVNRQVPLDYDVFVGLFGGRLGTPTHRSASGTLEEYERALAEVGATPQAKFRVSLGTDKMESAYRDMLAWLKTDPEMPTAFFAENDALAVGAMKALTECGYDIPGDISMVGFDDVEFAGVVHPGLTTVHVARADLGRIAVRKLIEQVEHPTRYTCVTHMSTTFVERDSVRALI